MARVNEIAAAIHADMCEDNGNGYSWSPRWGGDGAGTKTLTIDGREYTYPLGSYDCSSSVITAWRLAVQHTPYAGAFDGCSTTYDMRAAFLASGLFEWHGMDFIADAGDLYLDEDAHVAMCQSQVPDLLSEFSINENGGVYGGRVGDQTGTEACIHGYYGFADGILHYNGLAEGAMGGGAGGAYVPPNPDAPVPEARFRVKAANGWLPEGESGDGTPVTGIAVDFSGCGWYQAKTQKHGWLEPVRGYDISDDEDGYAGYEDSPIIAVRCYYETPDPSSTGYFSARYRVAEPGADWFDWQYDTDTWNGQDGYAGDGNPIDRFEIELSR